VFQGTASGAGNCRGGGSMSENQKTQAEQVIDMADKMLLEGYDSLTVLRRGLHKLNQLGLNVYDFTRYKRRLELVAGVK
jgi:hypothetical protein